MLVEVRSRCSDFDSYRAARVKSLFNAESGANFSLDAELPIEEDEWRFGVIVGPSGSGKSSLGRVIFGEAEVYGEPQWSEDQPVIDAIASGKDFNDVTAALAAVGLGHVPAWLRAYAVLWALQWLLRPGRSTTPTSRLWRFPPRSRCCRSPLRCSRLMTTVVSPWVAPCHLAKP